MLSVNFCSSEPPPFLLFPEPGVAFVVAGVTKLVAGLAALTPEARVTVRRDQDEKKANPFRCSKPCSTECFPPSVPDIRVE